MMMKDGCIVCGALGNVIDGMCYKCYEESVFDGHCPNCGKLCDYDEWYDDGLCGYCENREGVYK